MSIMLVRALVTAVERAGVSRAAFFAAASIEPAKLEDVQARIPIPEYRRLVRLALSLSGDAALGIHMGERPAMGSFDVLCHLMEHSTCLRDAIMFCVRYSRIVTDGSGMELLEDGESATIQLLLSDEDAPERRVGAEFASMGLLRLIRRFVDDNALPRHSYFRYPAPAHRTEYARAFGPNVHFSHAFTGMEIERAWLDVAPSFRPTELRTYLQNRADLLLAKVDQDVPVAERVKRWLVTQTAPARPTMDEVARELGLSPRSLRRRLHDERIPYNGLVDEVLSNHAKRMLSDPGRSIQETAYALGFNTPSAFSRAFKRWTGMAPSDFRAEF